MFNQEQIKKISNNKNVVRCSSKSITYTGRFKLEAVRQYYEQGYSPKMIFEKAGFDVDVISKDKIKGCLTRWRKIYNKKGEKELLKENRGSLGQGGKPKIKYDNDKDKMKYLETKIAYLEEENKYLKKMKKLEKP